MKGSLVLLLAVSLLSCGCQRRDYEASRPFAERSTPSLEVGQVGNTTRPFLRLAASTSRSREIKLGPIRRGTMVIYVAVDSPSATPESFSMVDLRLRGDGLVGRLLADRPATCHHVWRGTNEAVTWQQCVLPIARDYPDSTLIVRFEAPADAQLLLASPVLFAEPSTDGPRPPVFVILTDATRRDVLRPFDDRSPIGERLEELAEDSVTFEDLRAPSSWTRTSVATLLTGRSPSHHGVFDRLDALSPELPTLPSILQGHGYLTQAWSTNPNVLPMWGFQNGFDAFTDVGAFQWSKEKADASLVFAMVREAIDAAPNVPAFHYIHLMDTHAPYSPLERHLHDVGGLPASSELFPVAASNERAVLAWFQFQKYVAETYDVDEQIGFFVDFLEQRDLYNSSIILVLSDHGEEFLDHGGQFHGRTLYDEVLRVPGILKLPHGEFAGLRVETPVGIVDLLPTLLHALGIEPPANLDGTDLFEENYEEAPLVANLTLDEHRLASISYEGWKLIRDYVTQDDQLYDLVRDPKETRNRISDAPAKARDLGLLLDRMSTRSLEGWHLRACGCDQPSQLEIGLRSSRADLRGMLLEPEDSIAPLGDGSSHVLAFSLPPHTAQREVLGKLKDVTVRDEDEVLVTLRPGPAAVSGDATAAADMILSVGPPPGGVLSYALGRGPAKETRQWLDLTDLADDARVDASEPVECWPPAAPTSVNTPPKTPANAASRPIVSAAPRQCRPYLRVWHVTRPTSLEASDVDPEVVERLKALGYVW